MSNGEKDVLNHEGNENITWYAMETLQRMQFQHGLVCNGNITKGAMNTLHSTTIVILNYHNTA